MKKLHVKVGDLVEVISGKDAGKNQSEHKRGRVQVAIPSKGRVIVEGVNIVTKHQKARSMQDVGGIIKREAPIDASNVMLVCSKCNKATRLGHKILEDGTRVRVCKKCGETFDR
ncbi:MAG: 50S ribosomal protein L24 [Lachnospiraceae bacterium]|nr:50S ribosomal protein L24 [Lachnospiraceae bacterium]